MVVVEEDDDEEVTVGNTGSQGFGFQQQQYQQPQSVILRSNNPLNPPAYDGPINFDMQSKSSAYFVNEDEMAEYEA